MKTGIAVSVKGVTCEGDARDADADRVSGVFLGLGSGWDASRM